MLSQTKIQELYQIAHNYGLHSPCNKRKVGCVVVHPTTHEILSYGFNHGYSEPCSCDVRKGYKNAHATHAEIMALPTESASTLEGGIMVITHAPCDLGCADRIIESKLSAVYYGGEPSAMNGLQKLSQANIQTEHIPMTKLYVNQSLSDNTIMLSLMTAMPVSTHNVIAQFDTEHQTVLWVLRDGNPYILGTVGCNEDKTSWTYTTKFHSMQYGSLNNLIIELSKIAQKNGDKLNLISLDSEITALAHKIVVDAIQQYNSLLQPEPDSVDVQSVGNEAPLYRVVAAFNALTSKTIPIEDVELIYKLIQLNKDYPHG